MAFFFGTFAPRSAPYYFQDVPSWRHRIAHNVVDRSFRPTFFQDLNVFSHAENVQFVLWTLLKEEELNIFINNRLCVNTSSIPSLYVPLKTWFTYCNINVGSSTWDKLLDPYRYGFGNMWGVLKEVSPGHIVSKHFAQCQNKNPNDSLFVAIEKLTPQIAMFMGWINMDLLIYCLG